MSEYLERGATLYGGLDFLRPFLAAVPTEVLDVGCDAGHFTRRVAEALPGGRVTGVELDAGAVVLARSQASAPNVAFVQGDLAALPFPDGRFDLVFCRFVLVHLGDPTDALRELARVTKPGGRVVAYDMVHEGIWWSPEKPAFAALLRAMVATLRARGMEPSQGLHLASAMIRAGLRDVEARAIPHSALAGDDRLELHRRNWIETVAGLPALLGADFDPALLTRARAELERRSPDEFLLELAVLAHGRKPGGSRPSPLEQ